MIITVAYNLYLASIGQCWNQSKALIKKAWYMKATGVWEKIQHILLYTLLWPDMYIQSTPHQAAQASGSRSIIV